METGTLILFVATVLPLICTPGPDMLFVVSQIVPGGAPAGLRATAGVCLGYVGHSILVALGVAAIVATSPVLFAALRWLGVAYLVYLAAQLLRSAMRPGKLTVPIARSHSALRRGFLTAFLNPKGMMINFAILPQFMQHTGSIVLQAAVLGATFIGLCGIVYSALSIGLAAIGRHARFSDLRRRWMEGIAGGLLIAAAGRMAAT